MSDENKRAYQKAYYEANKERLKAGMKAWHAANKEKHLQQMVTYNRERSRIDVNFKLARRLRARLSEAVKHNRKGGSAINSLGCSIQELRIYLESKFQQGMSWNNYGLRGWHIDHIKPLSSFDLSDPEQVKIACSYTNLQPLWAMENLKKSDS